MKTISRYLMTLVALFAMTAGAWANIATIEFSKESVPGSWKNNFTPISPDYLPDFKPATDAEAIAWDGASKTNKTILIYGFDGEKVKYVNFNPTGGYQTRNEISSLYDFYEQVMENNCIVCYTTFAVFLNDTKTEASFDMPTYDLTVDYELVRDMGYGVGVTVNGEPTWGEGDDSPRFLVKKNGEGKYQPETPFVFELKDLFLDQNNPPVLAQSDYTLLKRQRLDEDGTTWNDLAETDDYQPGIYCIAFMATETSAYDGTVFSGEFEIYAKNITVDPVAATGLVYNGQPQALASEAECEGGEMRYSLDGETWSAQMPTVTDAGTYTLYYKVVTGDDDPDTDYKKIENIVVAKAQLAAATLVNATLIYDTFNHQPLTAEVNAVTAGEDGNVDVPAEDYTVEGNVQTDMGDYTATITAKAGSKNFTGSVNVDFSIVKEMLFVDNDNVPVTVTADPEAQTVTIDEIGKPLSGTVIHIPAEINGFKVTKIAAGALGDEVTDIYMPDTGEEPILVEAGAFPASAIIHTTLALLDDYALMSGLQPNYEATKVMTTVTPANRYWSFSCGVDVLLPEDLTANRVELINNNEVNYNNLTKEQLDMDGERVLKSNNGILMLGEAGKAYDLVAHPGRQASGSAISTDDAKDYGTNLLVPVIVPTHFEPADYYVLKNGQFCAIEDNDSKTPACKAVLKKPAGAALARVLNIVAGSGVTGLDAVIDTTADNETWYDLNGRKLDEKPTKKGLYIKNGKKVVMK